jgi:hypothetical protein
MAMPDDVDYTVILVFPGFGDERENAETIVESALEWLNNNREEPGFRFAPWVTAHLEIVATTEEARERIETDESVAMVILHELDEEERDAMLREVAERHIAACITVDGQRRRRRRKGPWRIVFRNKPTNEPPAHQVASETLTGPVAEDDEETGERIGQFIAVMALGVMEHHWGKSDPPSYLPAEDN